MKYITTKKHPNIKEGIIFRKSASRLDMYVSDKYSSTYITKFDIEDSIENGYIKEVEEKEFTRSELIEICYIRFGGNRDAFIKNLTPIIDEWQRQKDK